MFLVLHFHKAPLGLPSQYTLVVHVVFPITTNDCKWNQGLHKGICHSTVLGGEDDIPHTLHLLVHLRHLRGGKLKDKCVSRDDECLP